MATRRDTGRADALLSAALMGDVALGVRALDVTDLDRAPAVLEEVLADHGSPNVLENNAGRDRILTVTSVGGAVGQPFAHAYCGAKFAEEGYMQSLAVVAERFGVWVSVVEAAADKIADAATSETYRFRWQTSDGASSFVGPSLADLDGERVTGITRTWIG